MNNALMMVSLASLLALIVLDKGHTHPVIYGQFGPADSRASEEGLDRIFSKFIMPQTNSSHLGFALEKSRFQLKSDQAKSDLIHGALDYQFQDLITAFKPSIRRRLQKAWFQTSWVRYSSSNAYNSLTHPLGMLRVGRSLTFSLSMDSRFKDLPLLSGILRMVLLTHQIGPQLELLQKEGEFLFDESKAIRDHLSSATAYWALSYWLRSPLVFPVLEREARRSPLSLAEIRHVLYFLESFRATDEFQLLRSFLSVNFIATLDPRDPVNTHIHNWLHRSLNSEAGPQYVLLGKPLDSAEILRFPLKKSVSKCHAALFL